MSLIERRVPATLIASIAVLATAITCVYARHESRKQFSHLQALVAERDELEVTWSQLQLEQSTLSAHSEVEKRARNNMGMRNPAANEILVLRR